MTMHWGKTLGSKHTNIFKPHVKSENHSVGFPFNATKYRNSQEKLLWDQIWDEAMNHSLANRNSTYMQNVYMQKTRSLEDMLDRKVHPHSFTMVMVIASMFLFFTLAITIAVVVFCRKKNMVFAFQKSEQDDDGEYELDDMDTNTDMEYGSDNDDDLESGSPKKHYGQYLQVNNPTTCPLKPLMCVNNHNSSVVNSTREEQTSHSSPIYRPKRPLHSCDNRGAYQPINVTTSHTDMCNETSSNTPNDKFVLTTDVADSPTVSRKKSLLCVKNCKSNNSSNSNKRDGITNRVADGAVSSKCYNGDIPVISIPSRDQLSHTDNHSNNNVPSKEAQCKYQVNHKSLCIKSKAASNDMIEEAIRDYNSVKDCQLTPVANCDKYDTEISLLDNNVDSKNSRKKNYTEIAIVRLTSKNKSAKNKGEQERDTEPLISPSSSSRNSPCNKVLLNDNRKACQSEDIYSHAITTSSLQLYNDYDDYGNDDEQQYVRCTPSSNGQLSLQASPVKELEIHKCLYNHGGCQSLPSTPHDEAKTQGSVLKQLRQQWVTFDDALH